MIQILGIIGALDNEVDLFIKNLDNVKTTSKASMDFHSGKIDGRDVVIVKCGVGKVNAAVCTQILIDNYGIDSVICTGVAGALKEDLDFYDTVVSTDVIQHDVDATDFGHELGEIPNLGIKQFKADVTLVDLAMAAYEEVFSDKKVHSGRILTGDQFISSRERVNFLRETFDGSCVEMEGGAVGQVCHLNNIPFLIIRSISDKANGAAVGDFRKFADETAKKSYKLVRRIIRMYEVGNK